MKFEFAGRIRDLLQLFSAFYVLSYFLSSLQIVYRSIASLFCFPCYISSVPLPHSVMTLFLSLSFSFFLSPHYSLTTVLFIFFYISVSLSVRSVLFLYSFIVALLNPLRFLWILIGLLDCH